MCDKGRRTVSFNCGGSVLADRDPRPSETEEPRHKHTNPLLAPLRTLRNSSAFSAALRKRDLQAHCSRDLSPDPRRAVRPRARARRPRELMPQVVALSQGRPG